MFKFQQKMSITNNIDILHILHTHGTIRRRKDFEYLIHLQDILYYYRLKRH